MRTLHHCTLAALFFIRTVSSDSITNRVVTPVISSFAQRGGVQSATQPYLVSSRNAPPHDTKRLRGVENVLFGGSSNRVTNVRRWFHSSLIIMIA